VVRESLVVERVKDIICPPEFIGTLLEGDSIAVDVLTIVYPEGYELFRSTLDSIRVAEDCFEFSSEGGPQGDSCSLIALLNIMPEVVFGGAGKVL